MDEETEIWIECDRCGRAYGGPGVLTVIWKRGREVVCTECLARREGVLSASRGCGATETARGANTQ